MKTSIFISGQKYNMWTLVSFNSKDTRGRQLWLCKCDCGGEKILNASIVKCGRTKNCGCIHRPNRENLTDLKFNQYTFIRFDSIDKNRKALWLCRCDCGTEKVVCANSVKLGKQKHCGCLNKNNEDLTDQKFGKYTFVKFDSRDNRGNQLWLCRCDCGNEKIVRSSYVKFGHTKSCGCLKREREDFTGQKFNRYIFVSFHSVDINGNYLWLCKCDCGTEKIVRSVDVKSGNIKSCGCYHKEVVRKQCGKNSPSWRHDLTDEERKEDQNRNRSHKSKIWKKKVLKRDSYTCQCCKQRGGKLAVHHIYSYHSHKNLRYRVSNGIVLCVNCHKMFHKQFSNKYNTRRQLNKFLSEQRLKCKSECNS